MSFDARTAKALTPGQNITFSDYPGLRLTATQKTRTWIYRYKSPVDGRMRQIALGHWPLIPFPNAIVAWQDVKKQRDAGIDHALAKKAEKQAVLANLEQSKIKQSTAEYTVRRLCDDYLEGHIVRHRARKGAREIERMFNTMLEPLTNEPAVSITRAMAFDLINNHSGGHPVQAGKLRCELGAAWDYAIDSGRLTDSAVNWWRLILRGKIRSKGRMITGKRQGTQKRVLSEAELKELINWLPSFPEVTRDVLTMYLWTGTRGAEIVAMTGVEISDVDGKYWWIIPKAKTKNSRHANAHDHPVPLFGRALEVVLRRKAIYGNGYLFPSRDAGQHTEQKVIQVCVHYHQPYSKTTPERIRLRLPVTHWAPHDLRRTARTILARIGCPDSVGEMILGHMLPGIVGTYNRHGYDVERVEWLGRLNGYLDGLSEDINRSNIDLSTVKSGNPLKFNGDDIEDDLLTIL